MDRRKLWPKKKSSFVLYAAGAIVIVCVLALLFLPDLLANWFIKPRISKAFTKAFPAYSIRIADMNYSVFKNRVGFESVALSKVDGTFLSNIGSVSVSGINLMHHLRGGIPVPNDLANSDIDAQDIVLTYPQSHYELQCERLHVSVPDSEIVVEAVKLHPEGDDEQFFKASEFRNARYRLVIPHARVLGVAFLDLMQRKSYRARSAQIHDALIDVFNNKDKPVAIEASSPLMPNETLASIKETLQVDSVSVMNARLMYWERIEAGAKPGMVTFDSIQILAEGIANQGDSGDALVVHAQGKFLNAGTMTLLMTIPVASPEFSFQYSGSLSGMDVSALNLFLEPVEQIRVKSGVLQEATYRINVVSGQATGNVRAVYRDLSLTAINKETGSQKGLFNTITSFYANLFKINGTNVPNKSGSMKIGEVKYTRKRSDCFYEFAWFALRSGVADVVGF